MLLAREYVGSESQILVLLWSKVDNQITVRLTRRVFICFDGKLRIVVMHLSGQICKLTGVPRIFKQYHVVRVEAYCSCKFVFFWKQVLYEEQNAHVSIV